MPVILLHDMDYEGISEMRANIEKHIPVSKQSSFAEF
jgi:5S rRNA maturation endonuclease (ribonuclease M5)